MGAGRDCVVPPRESPVLKRGVLMWPMGLLPAWSSNSAWSLIRSTGLALRAAASAFVELPEHGPVLKTGVLMRSMALASRGARIACGCFETSDPSGCCRLV